MKDFAAKPAFPPETQGGGPVRLTHEPDFMLGDLQVSPSSCRVVGRNGDVRLEPRVMAVLVTLARAQGRTVGRDELIDTCWDGRIVTDNAVSRAVAQLRGLARLEPGAFQLETVPKVGFRLLIERDSSPESEVRRTTGAPRRLRKLPLLAAAVALALAGGLVVWRAADGARGERPWLDLTAAAAPQPGADVQQLRASLDDALVFAVAARGVDPAPGQRARSASARLRLTTAVERDKQYFVIRAKLSETGSGAVVWSKRFERAAGRTSGFAETTAAHVSDVAACAQRNAQRHRRELSTSLLALLLSACSAAQYEDVPAMLETTERLVRAAPNLADAHALHAAALMGATNVVDGDARGGALAIARAEAREALRLDPDNPEAHAVLGAGRGQSWMARDRHITRAMAVEPHDSRVDTVDIFFLQATGRSREAASVAARSAAEDPFNGGALERLAWLQAVQGRVPDAWATVRRLELVDPPLAEDLRLRIAFWHGPPAEAVPMLRSPSDGADAEVAKCMRDYLAARAAAGLPQSCRGVQSDIPVRLLGRSGQLDAAYAVADIPPRELNAGTLYLFYPEMAAFRRDPRFMPLADRLGLVDYWLQSGHWPDFCAEPGLPYDCRAVARRLHGG